MLRRVPRWKIPANCSTTRCTYVARGRFSAHLIDEVHMLSRHSFNALLKTLEEPPLCEVPAGNHGSAEAADHHPLALPAVSHLKSLDQTQIAKQLEWVLDQEGQPFEPRALAGAGQGG